MFDALLGTYLLVAGFPAVDRAFLRHRWNPEVWPDYCRALHVLFLQRPARC